MMYSKIVGEGFYGIKLTKEQFELIDHHFTAAGHHRIRAQEAYYRPSNQDYQFHSVRYRAHLAHLMAIIYVHGDFGQAYDWSLKGLDRKESWNPRRVSIPDDRMFNNFLHADYRYELGKSHLNDELLRNMHPPVVHKNFQDGLPALRLVGSC